MRASKFILGAAASALLAATSLLAPRAAAAAERLPALGVDLGQTTVSGLSSGAYMAVQFHVAFSGIVRGVGVVAGGPYYCAEGQLLTNALNRCMGTRLGEPDPDRLLRLARGFARRGLIDPVETLASGRAYLFTGANDRTVVSPVVDAARRFYAGRAFVRVTDKPPQTKWATGSNLAFVSYAADPERELVIAMGVVDNLGKGAAGQAVQNANLICGLPETAGLDGAPVWP